MDELEMVNGFTIIARAFDRRGRWVILAVRRRGEDGTPFEFEYVTAYHNRGDSFWDAGRYSNSWMTAFDGFSQEVQS